MKLVRVFFSIRPEATRPMKPVAIAMIFLVQIASASATTSSAAVQYRWRDHSAIEYGNTLPPNAGATGYDILDGDGKLVRHVAPSVHAVAQAVQAEAARAEPKPISATASAPLTLSECTRLVHRTFFNMKFSKTPGPFDTKMVASCMAGLSFFNRSYYNCVFSTKYSDTLDCAYAAKGIDRSKRQPILATRKTGEEGGYEGAAKEMEAAVYHGQDPRTTIDQITLDRYLDERDNIDRSLGEKPPADRDTPLRKSASHSDANGQTFWVVREEFVELQIAKVMHQNAKGTDNVFCVQFGDSRRLRLDQGLCNAMIRKYLHVALAD